MLSYVITTQVKVKHSSRTNKIIHGNKHLDQIKLFFFFFYIYFKSQLPECSRKKSLDFSMD